MTLENLHSGSFGTLQTHSLAIGFQFEREHMSRIYHRYGRQGIIREEELNWSRISFKDRSIYLTDIHEMDHFAQMISTPAGVLIWRLYQVLVRDVSYLASEFQRVSLAMDCGGNKVVDWYQREGHRKLEQKFKSEKKGLQRLFYLENEVLRGIRSVDQLLDILLCRDPSKEYANYTVGEFLDLLNFVFPYLARRCDIQWSVVWDSRLGKKEKLFPDLDRAVNLRGTLELLARLKEHRAMTRMHASDEDFMLWKKERLPTELIRPFDFFHSYFSSSSEARGLISKALLGRIDLCASSGQEDVLYVEDEWPWWRCWRPLEGLSDEKLLHILASGLLSLDNIASKGKLYGEKAKWDAVVEGKRHEYNDKYAAYLKRLQNSYVKGIRTHHDALLAGGYDVQNVLLKELLLIEYADEISFYQVTSVFSEMFDAILFGIFTRIGVAVARGEAMRRPERTGEKLAKSIEERIKAIQQSGIPNSPDSDQLQKIPAMIRQMFTKDTFERFLLGSEVVWVAV